MVPGFTDGLFSAEGLAGLTAGFVSTEMLALSRPTHCTVVIHHINVINCMNVKHIPTQCKMQMTARNHLNRIYTCNVNRPGLDIGVCSSYSVWLVSFR